MDIYGKLAIPDSCYLGKRIFKKLFLENTTLNAADRKAFTQDVDEVTWKYTLKPETINIGRYEDEEREYHEIAIIQVNLKGKGRYRRIGQIIQRAVPYPILIVFCCDSSIALHVASKRISLGDSEKMIVEDLQDTGWFDLEKPNESQREFLESLCVTSFSFNNYFEFYSDLTERMVALQCSEISGQYSYGKNAPDVNRVEVLEKINTLTGKQNELRSILKKETQFNQKVELNMQIKKLSEQIQMQKSLLV